MFKRISKEIKDEILGKVAEGKFSVPKLAEQYAISDKTIYSWLRNSTDGANISAVEFNKLRRENDELKRIIGIVTLQMEREKKGKAGPLADNKKLIATAIGINRKNVYFKNIEVDPDLEVKNQIEACQVDNPSYGHRRIAWDLKMNHKKILRVMHKHLY